MILADKCLNFNQVHVFSELRAVVAHIQCKKYGIHALTKAFKRHLFCFSCHIRSQCYNTDYS